MRPELTVEQVLAWADDYHKAHGCWPKASSGRVVGASINTWSNINSLLKSGRRGLPGGSSLIRLLAEHRGRPDGNRFPALTVEQILTWADDYQKTHGCWPNVKSGRVSGAPSNTWRSINSLLKSGRRGLPRGSSLVRLLAEHRGRPMGNRLPPLTVEQILAWADDHHEAQGCWPAPSWSRVAGAPTNIWNNINTKLSVGGRGLPGGTTLVRLLAQYRGRPLRIGQKRPELTIALILRWADGYHKAHGRWPKQGAGLVTGTSSDTWDNISKKVAEGGRGLPGGSTLARLLAEHRGVRNRWSAPDLNPDRILAWADAHHAATGEWPTTRSGSVSAAPGEKWYALNNALRLGSHGLPGGSSLSRLIDERRRPWRGALTVEMIWAWCEAHHAATGRWPHGNSGAIAGAPGETWARIIAALQQGRRGLPGGMSLMDVYAPSSGSDRTAD